ncbi:MAG: flagellar protein export ATPase FliI [Pseudomonadales bacterium]|nr:flagellar protein export ATPase FliI [Pseudomonadales bacterium]
MLEKLQRYRDNLEKYDPTLVARGRLIRVTGLMLEASGCKTSIGSVCRIASDGDVTEAEVVGFEGDRIFMMPIGTVGRLRPGAEVLPVADSLIGVGNAYLGRVIDGVGAPLDGKGEIIADEYVSMNPQTINPLHREPIRDALDVGITALNSMVTVGRGQRLGLFAGSGVGKSVLLGMMTRFTNADIIIVGLVGERGREVKEFIENILDEKGMSRSIVIASPADDSPAMKIRAANLATRMAEYFRDQKKDVLLLLDSLTRYAQAQRQIALAVGEPPSTKGYPPSVFAKIPDLVERAGNGGADGGSVTAFYTVLSEGDDLQDPVADSARAILDGHIVLSRRLAESGHYPAIDVEASVSRTMPAITSETHLKSAQRFRQIYACYRRNEDLITVGAYSAGSDAALDEAVARFPSMQKFLQQGMNEQVPLPEAISRLESVLVPPQSPPGAQVTNAL